ncbi:MAG: DNA-directed RNA polymerase subunit beta' [Candidatus Portnoybacteria bacterium RIFCSPLOWO2_12_FULL_39_9]|uniref:DNA-directed RNA polymerase subunit beta' n=1 Tax=Candidatus Portnoybacteria bacterium RIFCSPHIGHO2_12_FULL_38_9 TaxID=1801997 RepID=A0A1G2FEU9_9BACT|nr:MAG: DNA-directed RNA polymerase subunit beta' [Candidatus Portnoybacteria bacterium RIFCSPHIGHO2_02_FULL_39_12]OGZ36327.1 MAG: DNA-directed RNA polymerase subunit beta' [Candidatus Portnoybacteria bacterium RIFCSPHIGHO2_12_FULL_38_9]OGZ37783.1 MAG: DNA-directed RNA polymerase subunit beta' [Candidatus Portnoybacteria bacterium RIFCSPLOWO2_01_FULL_38_39]OGZ40790.1 MAG: DNA-directed RNA polymerase subunit beta' [Candidatus Portnoybacteria bacterium RIFCSPLOWO2_12_FULL_39_9]
MNTRVADFKAIKLKLASPEEILKWSFGEVIKPETINYRTQRPEKDGLFCEKIFGPEKDWECYCGKYRRIRYKGVICDKCGVEVTRAIVRRERMGHIGLAAPVSHIWFLRGVPSKIGLILDAPLASLEKVIYFAGYIITKVDEGARKKAIEEAGREYKTKLKSQIPNYKSFTLPNFSKKNLGGQANSKNKDILKQQRDKAIRELRELRCFKIIGELEYRDLSLRFGHVFEAGTGAETLRKIFEEINLEKLAGQLEGESKEASSVLQRKIQKRLRLIKGMIEAGIRPEWMLLTNLPVLPPDLRPMVQLDGGRYATSDVNDLYRRVINRNNRLKRLLELKAPEVICRNEKRMLQEAVDALIDNTARRGQAAVSATTGQKRILRSLADMLKGKQGRFRHNLLGKRVDYSGRSVIVVGPELKLHQCGLPKHMALELFKPFVINKLVERGLAHNVRGAGHLIEQETDDVWSILEEVIKNRCVLLNRAPTLHRLGVQAFHPVLVEGNAIQIHPIVCRAFNADFDGDQMAVHLPLGEKAQEEAREIMLSSRNLLKPATGEPVAIPTQDIVLGCYWLTDMEENVQGQGKIFSSVDEALLAKHFGYVDLRARIRIYLANSEQRTANSSNLIETSVGRLIFNEPLPRDFGFINKTMNQRELRKLVGELISRYGLSKTALILDRIKRMGFKYASVSGISWGMDDLEIPKEKDEMIKAAKEEVEIIQKQYLDGLLTDDERRGRVIEVWSRASEEISKVLPRSLSVKNPVYTMINSGSRGSWIQIAQMMGMKGLVVNPSGETIELPVISSYKEGFNVLEYFIATHGGRKGLADTALRTATAGYLTRRLVDVCQDIVIREEDCGDKEGINIYREDEEELGNNFSERVIGRVALEQIPNPKSQIPNSKFLIKPGQLIDKETAQKIEAAGLSKIRVRSVITCQAITGVCQKCYGYDLGHNQLVKLGEAVGIVTAQAIGEPGTQLTLRTFHTGGVAGSGDITQGLPRVEEIFEARSPKGKALISEVSGQVAEIEEKGGQKVIRIKSQITNHKSQTNSKFKKIKNKKEEKEEIKEYFAPLGAGVLVDKGDLAAKGQQLSEGHIDLKELYKLAGQEAVQRYIIKEVQTIYTMAGENISDKHIEMIIRQMFSRLLIIEPGQTNFLIGQIVGRVNFYRENERAKNKGLKPALAQPLLLGITKISLSADSFLSAASFQETARVLIEAAVLGKVDRLKGLKENVIIGKLIPAGTGFRK